METIAAVRKMRGVDHEAEEPLLAVDGVTAAYTPAGGDGVLSLGGDSEPDEARYALYDVTFQVDGGERVAVVGPNGAGKSTLFKVIAGILKPRRGTVRVYGHGSDEHICIAYVPQRSQIDWSFPATVEDVVMMGRVGRIGLFRRPRREDWDKVHASLEQVNGGHLAHKQIDALSGGQQQRVFIARALAQQAELLLLDEPFTGLDAPSHEALFAIMESLRAAGVTVMVATHDLNLAAERFDRVMLLNGEMMAYGPPAGVLTSQNLVNAYGGHMHVLQDEGTMILADTCCEGDPK